MVQISDFSIKDNTESLTKQLSSPEYSKNSNLQKPLLLKLINISLYINTQVPCDIRLKYLNLCKHLSDDLIIYLFEELSKCIETKGYMATFLTNEVMTHIQTIKNNITDHQSLIIPLKKVFEKSIFNKCFNVSTATPVNIENMVTTISMGDIMTNIQSIIYRCLEASNKKINNGQSIDKQLYTETFDLFKYIILIPVKLALIQQGKDTFVYSKIYVTQDANCQTILESNTFEIDLFDFDMWGETFRNYYYFSDPKEDNYKNILEYIYQLLMSLICQNTPSLYPKELDKDIFDLISFYKFNTKFINILINHYTRHLSGISNRCPLGLQLLGNAFNIYSKVPCDHNMDYILEYLNVVETFINCIKRNIKPKDNLIDGKSYVSMTRTILLIILNIYLKKRRFFLSMALLILNTLLDLLLMFDKVLFIRFINYLTDHMLDVFIKIYNNDTNSRKNVFKVISTLINGILGLDKPMREKLLAKFDKWFILTLQEFNALKDTILIWASNDSSGTPYYYSFLNSYQLYYKEKVSIFFLDETLSWLSSHNINLETILLFINKTNKYISPGTKTFSDNFKLHLASNMITRICFDEKGGILIPDNYQYILDKIECKGKKEFCNGIESLIQMCMGK